MVSVRWLPAALIWISVAALAIPGGGFPAEFGSTASSPGPAHRIVTDAIALPSHAMSVPMPPGRLLRLTFALEPSNGSALGRELAALDRPGSAQYRHFLTESEFESRFAPGVRNVSAIIGFLTTFRAHSVEVARDRLTVSGVLPVLSAERALGVTMVEFGRPGAQFAYTAEGNVELPASIARMVFGIGGLSSPRVLGSSAPLLPHPLGVVLNPPPAPKFVFDPASASDWFVGTDFTQAYGETALFPPSPSVPNATFPNRSAVATILMSGYNLSANQDLPPWDPAVVYPYFNDTLAPGWPKPSLGAVPVTIAGLTPPQPGPLGTLIDDTASQSENSIDLEMAGSSAPGAALVNFYFSGSLYASPASTASVGDVADDFASALGMALSFNYSPARLVAVSNSYGLPDLNDSAWDLELQHAQAIGVTVLASSGDQGDAPPDQSGDSFQGQWPTWPGTAAFNDFGTVAVGATSVAIFGQPTTNNTTNLTLNYSTTDRGLQAQQVWYDVSGGAGNVTGSEGGASTVVSEPRWQFRSAAQPEIVNATIQQGLSTLDRAEPDLALAGNATIAYIYENSSGLFYDVFQGTSISSPLLAGFLAEWSAVSGHLFGYLAPELYRIGSYFAANPASAPAFFDVVSGGNYLFPALSGWDAATGWGAPNATGFLAADANPAIRDYNYTGPTPGLPPPAPALRTHSVNPLVGIILIAGLLVAVVLALLVVFRPRPPSTPYSSPADAYGPTPHSPARGTSDSGSGRPLSSRYGEPQGDPVVSRPPTAYGVLPGVPGSVWEICAYCERPRPPGLAYCPSCGAG